MTKKTLSKIISFSLCIFALVCGVAIYQYREVNTYKKELAHTYQRAFYNLINYVKTIDASLEKGVHSASPNQLVLLSSEIWREAGGAITALSQLPLSDIQIEKLTKYLSQVGDYTHSLSRKVVNNEEIFPEEQEYLQELSTYSRQLTKDFLVMEEQIAAGTLSLEKIKTATLTSEKDAPTFWGDQLVDVEKKFGDYPSLIYDGPFSDHLEQQEPLFLKDKGIISVQEAKKRAATLLGIDPIRLSDPEAGKGKIPTYTFSAGKEQNPVISLTKQGGFPLYLLNSRPIGEATLKPDEAIAKAQGFLSSLGFTNMKESYYLESNGILMINFAYCQGDYICYSDLIKVGIALDDGSVMSFESHGYLMNHIDNRDIPPVVLSVEEAVSKLNPRLTPHAVTLALIPTDYNVELPVYSILCTNSENRNYIVFINTQSGREEKILMLIKTDSGTLTM